MALMTSLIDYISIIYLYYNNSSLKVSTTVLLSQGIIDLNIHFNIVQIQRRLEKIKKDYSYSTNVKHQCDNGLTKVINRTQSHLKGPTCCLGAFAVKPEGVFRLLVCLTPPFGIIADVMWKWQSSRYILTAIFTKQFKNVGTTYMAALFDNEGRP